MLEYHTKWCDFPLLFFQMLGETLRLPLVRDAAKTLPQSWKALLLRIGFAQAGFDQYAVCPICSTIYEMAHAVDKMRTGYRSARCSHVRCPGHRQARMRQPCGAKLLRTVPTSKGDVLRPFKVYSVRPLISYSYSEEKRLYRSWKHAHLLTMRHRNIPMISLCSQPSTMGTFGKNFVGWVFSAQSSICCWP